MSISRDWARVKPADGFWILSAGDRVELFSEWPSVLMHSPVKADGSGHEQRADSDSSPGNPHLGRSPLLTPSGALLPSKPRLDVLDKIEGFRDGPSQRYVCTG